MQLQPVDYEPDFGEGKSSPLKDYVARPVAQAGRMALGAGAGLADLATSIGAGVTNPLLYGASKVADTLGYPETGTSLLGSAYLPGMTSEQALHAYDKATGDLAAPRNLGERMSQMAGETLLGLPFGGALTKLGKAPAIIQNMFKVSGPADVAGALGAGATSQYASEKYPDSPVMQSILPLIAAITPAAASQVGRRSLNAVLPSSEKSMIDARLAENKPVTVGSVLGGPISRRLEPFLSHAPISGFQLRNKIEKIAQSAEEDVQNAASGLSQEIPTDYQSAGAGLRGAGKEAAKGVQEEISAPYEKLMENLPDDIGIPMPTAQNALEAAKVKYQYNPAALQVLENPLLAHITSGEIPGKALKQQLRKQVEAIASSGNARDLGMSGDIRGISNAMNEDIRNAVTNGVPRPPGTPKITPGTPSTAEAQMATLEREHDAIQGTSPEADLRRAEIKHEMDVLADKAISGMKAPVGEKPPASAVETKTAYQQADKAYAEGKGVIDDILGLVDNPTTTDENLIKRYMNLGNIPSGKGTRGADMQLMRSIHERFPQEALDKANAFKVAQLGKNERGEFDALRASREWGGISDEAKDLMFRGREEQRQALDRTFNYLKQGFKGSLNPSGTGSAVLDMAALRNLVKGASIEGGAAKAFFINPLLTLAPILTSATMSSQMVARVINKLPRSVMTQPWSDASRKAVTAALVAEGMPKEQLNQILQGEPTEQTPAPQQEEQPQFPQEPQGQPKQQLQLSPQSSATPKTIPEMISTVANAYGNDPRLMQAIMQQESSGNATATNGNVAGLYQFKPDTWKDMVSKYGKKLGISYRDRMDPVANSIMANLYMKENRERLGGLLGRAPGNTDLYLAHFLGPTGAVRFLSNIDTEKPAAQLLPEAARANPDIFSPGGYPLTPKQIYQMFQAKMG